MLPQVSLADYVTGLFGALGAMTALYHRDVFGGEAQEVDVALYESMFRMLETVVTQYDRLGVVRERTGNELGASVPAGIFSSKVGKWMVLTTSTDRAFRRLAKELFSFLSYVSESIGSRYEAQVACEIEDSGVGCSRK